MASSFYARYIPPEPSPSAATEGSQSSKLKRKLGELGDIESPPAATPSETPPVKLKRQKRKGNDKAVPVAVDGTRQAQGVDNARGGAEGRNSKQQKGTAGEGGAEEAKPGRGETRNTVNPDKSHDTAPKGSDKLEKTKPGKASRALDDLANKCSDVSRIGANAGELKTAGEAKNKRKTRKETYPEPGQTGDNDIFDTVTHTEPGFKSKAKEGSTPAKPERSKKKKEGFVGHGHTSRGQNDDNQTNQGPADFKPIEQQALQNPGGKREKLGKQKAREEDPRSEYDESDEDMEGDTKYKAILSKFQRSTQISKKLAEESSNEANHDLQDQGPLGLQGLVPLPQPEEVPDPTGKPAFSALPPWLAHPTTVPSSSTIPFRDLPINAKLISSLELKGYRDAFAIQSVVLPMLLPGPTQYVGDLCISAATGSGKTLAYVLPIVESLRNRTFTRLRGLIVVPTRELVTQVKEVCELCSSGSGLNVGIAVGSRPLKAERDLLIKRGQKYDPEAYREIQKITTDTENELDYDCYDEFDPEDDLVTLPEHVPSYTSKVDILICTPGRLVDHIRSTPGFTLGYLQWLVIDEADRLLDQSFQEWVDVVLKALESTREYDQMNAHEQMLVDMGLRPPKSNTKKVVLSATMTRDVGKLSALRLRKPNLVVADDHGSIKSKPIAEGRDDGDGGSQGGIEEADAFGLPPALKEWAVPAGDGNEKPLYLLQLLQTKILDSGDKDDIGTDAAPKEAFSTDDQSEVTPNEGPISDNDSESVSSHGPSPSSDTSIDDSSSADDSKSDSASSFTQTKTPRDISYSKNSKSCGVLIFTKSNESAIRLSRLLSLLHPPLASRIGTLTGSIPSATRRKMLAAFRANKLPILLVSDLVARGLDVENVVHIVNYDLPKSVKGYVHRVGRTARAGRKGEAWTLVTQKEARWFWNEIAGGASVRRSGDQRVARVRLDTSVLGLEGRKRYEEALNTLKSEVRGGPSSA